MLVLGGMEVKVTTTITTNDNDNDKSFVQRDRVDDFEFR
jgi:hypothetical protein